jgi:integrase/recombinase XerD
MKLSEAAAEYVAHKQTMGMRFCTEERILKSFCRAMGDITMTEVCSDRVSHFIAGKGPVTRFWHRKHEVLLGFYRFAIARSYVAFLPLPGILPKPPQAFVPYIYSHDELRGLLQGTAFCANSRSNIEPDTFRTLILLLYGAGLRISEALALTLADVDLAAGIIHIEVSKFYKARLVPISPNLTRALGIYATKREIQHSSRSEAPFFLSRSGDRLTRRAAEYAFSQLRARVEVLRHDGARYQPRLHDLRHTFAVHRLLEWYRQGADVQRLLPQLATYLGHIHIAATQRYLTMTPELLHEASRRFERYAREGSYE